MSVRIAPVAWEDVRGLVLGHLNTLPVPVDSFLEDHILDATHYHILVDEEIAGWTSVHGNTMTTQFGMLEPYKHLGQPVFQRVRRLEHVQRAMVPTCDEFFLSHALDDYRLLEKQGYFFQVAVRRLHDHPRETLQLRPAQRDDLDLIVELSGSFFDNLEQHIEAGEMFIVQDSGQCAGFGIIVRNRLCADVASIGMYVVESVRRRGMGTAIVRLLIDTCMDAGLQPVAGCWYYNHASRKTLEKAGMFTQTRLLRISY